MEETLVLNLDKVRQGIAVGEGELLHKPQMDLLLDKIRQIMKSVKDFRQQFSCEEQRPSSISHRRHHDAILLSGARGTGKTTFLLAALHKLQREKLDENYSFHVFEPVDPTLFGYNEHILLTLISMIAKAVCRCRNHSETSRYCHSGTSDVWEAWENQLKDLAKGLQTVGEQREDIGNEPSPKESIWEDAEYLLEKGIDKARSSYELEYKLHSFINTSLKLLDKDAFVLGLDDVDTRPGIGWHILEVLRRYLTTPQIVVIVSGNMELFQKLVERRQLKTFGLDFSSNENVLQKFSSQVTELTNQYLLKILRTPLRIELLPFYEALERAFLIRKKQKDASYNSTDNTREEQKDTSDNTAIDNYCVIKFDGKRDTLTKILATFYKALSCGNPKSQDTDNPQKLHNLQKLQAVFRKALLDNSARTVLQIAEQLIELQHSSQDSDSTMQIHRVADILRNAFFDYLAASGIDQPQAYFERLRKGVGIEKITRLLLAGSLPGDASLRPIHGDLRENNTLLALTSGLTAAAAVNRSVFFLYFFKVCFVLQLLDGQRKEEINALLGETSLTTLAFRCSSLLYYSNVSRLGWRAPGILGIYGAAIKKSIPEHAKKIYGDDIVDRLNDTPPEHLLKEYKELLPFLQEMCQGKLLPRQRGGMPRLKGYFMATYDSLQDNIKSWHQALVPHGFYEVTDHQGITSVFFSFWGLLGLMTEILTCTTEEDIFNIFSRNARPARFARHGDANTSSSTKPIDSAYIDDSDETDISDTSDNDTDQEISAWAGSTLGQFIQRLMAWKKDYADTASVCFLPPVLCERVFKRFLFGMERLNNVNSSNIFLGSYIHRSIVILFNALLVEEYLAGHDDIDGLNLKTPLSSDDIFIKNIRKVAAVEKLETGTAPAKLSPEKYPLTRLVMACPLWSFYIKPDDETPESISDMLQCFWPDHVDHMDQVSYLDTEHQFDNLYYIYNALAIRRKIGLQLAPKTEQRKFWERPQPPDLRTNLGKHLELSPNPPKIVSNTLLEALKQAIKDGILTKAALKELDDGTDNFAKKVFKLLYIECPGTEQLWTKATGYTKQTFLKALRTFLANDSTGNA